MLCFWFNLILGPQMYANQIFKNKTITAITVGKPYTPVTRQHFYFYVFDIYFFHYFSVLAMRPRQMCSLLEIILAVIKITEKTDHNIILFVFFIGKNISIISSVSGAEQCTFVWKAEHNIFCVQNIEAAYLNTIRHSFRQNRHLEKKERTNDESDLQPQCCND